MSQEILSFSSSSFNQFKEESELKAIWVEAGCRKAHELSWSVAGLTRKRRYTIP